MMWTLTCHAFPAIMDWILWLWRSKQRWPEAKFPATQRKSVYSSAKRRESLGRLHVFQSLIQPFLKLQASRSFCAWAGESVSTCMWKISDNFPVICNQEAWSIHPSLSLCSLCKHKMAYSYLTANVSC
jgi:hypothetical protein